MYLGAIVDGTYRLGDLVAQGTPAQRILFTSDASSPAPGDWKGIYFRGLISRSGTTFLDYCTVEYGGNIHNANLYIEIIEPIITNSTITMSSGSGIVCSGVSPMFVNNTVSHNANSGIRCEASSPTLRNSIVVFSLSGEAIHCDDTASLPVLTCCDVFGNAGGDWVGCISGQDSVNNNLSSDPRFCNPAGNDFHLAVTSVCLPENNLCGVMIGALPAGCGAVYMLTCPSDSFIPAFSTMPPLELSGFQITNLAQSESLSFLYTVSTAGPCSLMNNGGPASLSGVTPLLEPGQSWSPPEASLDIPPIREYAEQFVTYRVTPVGIPDDVDSCITSITFEPPVPVLVRSFTASALRSSIELEWDILIDDGVMGFKIYRSIEGGRIKELVNDILIPIDARKYMDSEITSGRIYEYILGIVLNDGSERVSQTVTVKIKANELALHQNHPNPFNPSTTISFTLPDRKKTSLSIYNIEGKLVSTLIDKEMDGGYTEVTWNGTDTQGNPVSSGIYFYRLKAGSKTLTKKMVLLK
jgi:hypothetical protein